jgi:hypothetical protein
MVAELVSAGTVEVVDAEPGSVPERWGDSH